MNRANKHRANDKRAGKGGKNLAPAPDRRHSPLAESDLRIPNISGAWRRLALKLSAAKLCMARLCMAMVALLMLSPPALAAEAAETTESTESTQSTQPPAAQQAAATPAAAEKLAISYNEYRVADRLERIAIVRERGFSESYRNKRPDTLWSAEENELGDVPNKRQWIISVW